mgnify:CR=1 FL=1
MKITTLIQKRKQLIINKKSLAITQRKYNKTYYYPISKSHFVDILNKEKLVNLINQSVINIVDEQINLINTNGIIILFNKSNYNLMGWEIKDKFNNKVSFLIDIIAGSASHVSCMQISPLEPIIFVFFPKFLVKDAATFEIKLLSNCNSI